MRKSLISSALLLAAVPALILTAASAQAGSNVSCANVKATGTAARWYTIARTQADEGLLNLAFHSLERTLGVSDSLANPALAASALDCMERIQRERKSLELPAYGSFIEKLHGQVSGKLQDAVKRYAFRALIQRISEKTTESGALMNVLRGSKAHAAAAQGLTASIAGNSAQAKTALLEALNGIKKAPAEVRSIEPELRLALARSHYAMGEREAALQNYEKLFRIGRPLQDALIESGWTHLKGDNFAKALGLSQELQTGKLSRFFAPEASSIQAIALIENCRYADAKKSVERFSVEYAPVVEWLTSTDQLDSLYETAIARAEGVIGEETIPDRVWSIWSTSDVFTALQAGIRDSFREERLAQEWITSEVEDARSRKVYEQDIARMIQTRTRQAERIERHLEKLNRSMLARITRESERLRFVRIEANQGASRDLVYLNAHPEVQRLEASLRAIGPQRKGKLHWGRARLNNPDAELWIDEIGSFEAKSLNRCGLQAGAKQALSKSGTARTYSRR